MRDRSRPGGNIANRAEGGWLATGFPQCGKITRHHRTSISERFSDRKSKPFPIGRLQQQAGAMVKRMQHWPLQHRELDQAIVDAECMGHLSLIGVQASHADQPAGWPLRRDFRKRTQKDVEPLAGRGAAYTQQDWPAMIVAKQLIELQHRIAPG
jgi:hypothetical protein